MRQVQFAGNVNLSAILRFSWQALHQVCLRGYDFPIKLAGNIIFCYIAKLDAQHLGHVQPALGFTLHLSEPLRRNAQQIPVSNSN